MEKISNRSRGRPRAFDRDAVLDRAVITFWSKGFSGASIDDLTAAMGINRPSLYAAFGSKQDLYLAAIDRYAQTHGSVPVKALLGERDVRTAVAAFFDATVRCATTAGGPKGCLIVCVAIEDAEKDDSVRTKLSGIFTHTDRVIADYLRAIQADGQSPGEVDPQALAGMIISVTHSLAARARVGAGRNELNEIARNFMAVLLPGR
jgi:AcrR family transcriptional regulator